MSLSIAPGHADGPEKSAVRVIEFNDFECPQCQRASAIFEDLRTEFAGSVQFVLKHFPLDRRCNDGIRRARHKHACSAAEAAVCAGRQNRLWEFQEQVFARGVDDAALVSSAKAVGLDIEQWRQCRWSTEAARIVQADIADGLRLGVRSTPTFIINDQVVVGVGAPDALAAAIRKRLLDR